MYIVALIMMIVIGFSMIFFNKQFINKVAKEQERNFSIYMHPTLFTIFRILGYIGGFWFIFFSISELIKIILNKV